LILAAGKGKRLGALTKKTPKPLIPVAGKSILERIIDGLKGAADIEQFIVVTGYKHEKIESFLSMKFKDPAQYKTVFQEVQDGTGSAVSICRKHLSRETFFMTFGDILVDNSFYGRMMKQYQNEKQFNYMAVNPVDDPTIGCAVYFDGKRVKKLVEKPPKGASETRYNNSGIYILQPEIFNALNNISYSSRGELELTSALNTLALNNKMKHAEIPGFWSDIGTVKRLREATKYFLNKT